MSLENFTAAAVLESENVEIPTFTSDIPWKLGSITRELAIKKYPGQTVKIDIISASGEQLFHTIVGDGTTPDNDNWVRRKRNTVLKFYNSSFYIGRKNAERGRTLLEGCYYDEKDYATHGGGVPIKVKGVNGIVGVLTISGLKQWEDHFLGIEALKQLQ